MFKILREVIQEYKWFHSRYLDLRVRFIYRPRILKIKEFGPYEFPDADEVMFHAVFQILVNFVERELAGFEMSSAAYMIETKSISSDTLYWYKLPFWKKWKDRKHWKRILAFSYLNKAISNNGEENKEMVKQYQKIKDLYEWYIFLRPNRKDPFSFKYPKSYDLMEKFAEEDTKKMIELAQIRRSLWT